MEINPTFNVVMAYEDFDTGKRAMRTYDYLVQHLGDECLFKNQMWKFDVLAVAERSAYVCDGQPSFLHLDDRVHLEPEAGHQPSSPSTMPATR